MADNLLRIEPELHFPVGIPFQIGDQFNGPRWGNWFFRSLYSGILHGPFRDFDHAMFHLSRDDDGA